jgi:hypothetical protein
LSETGKVLERPTILMFKKNTTDNTTSDCPRNAASQLLELRDVHTHGACNAKLHKDTLGVPTIEEHPPLH